MPTPTYYPGRVSAETYFKMNPKQIGWTLAQIWEGRNPDGTTIGPTGQPSGGPPPDTGSPGPGPGIGVTPPGAGPGGADPTNPEPVDDWVRPALGDWPSDWPAIVNGFSPKLPAMTAYDRAEMIKRAHFGYSVYGYRSRQGTDLNKAWDEVERMKAFTGEQAATSRYAYNDFDFALYGTLIRMWNLTYVYGSASEPRIYAGFTLESYYNGEVSKGQLTGGTAGPSGSGN